MISTLTRGEICVEGGKVYLVGAGPGDAELITLKGMKALQNADVVLYDRLVNPILLQHTKQNTELIYCGKLPDRHILRQEAINELLVTKGLEGKLVVRLKGGDPSVFGRVGEEAQVLVEANIPFEIVPGITSSIGAASYAGVPVTHRDYGSTFAFVTGHDKSKQGHPSINWSAIAQGIDTIAFYMGIGNLDYITSNLIQYGKDPKTPVIVIQWGTYGRQKTLEGTLESITELVRVEKLENSAMTLVGPIVKLREKLAWFEHLPLKGKEVMLVRTGNEPSKIAKSLIEKGAEVFHFPTFHKSSLIQTKGMQSVLVDLTKNETQTLFLSPESVKLFFRAIEYYNLDIRKMKGDFYTGSIKSELELKKFGCGSQIWNPSFKGKKLYIFGEEKKLEHEVFIEKYGDYEYIPTHKYEISNNSKIILERILQDSSLNTVIFPSAATVSKFLDGITPIIIEKLEKKDIQYICFGETTNQEAKRKGLRVDKVLPKPTIDELIAVLTQHKLVT